jgi:hypothetical protein|tara:strand:+ start:129 stop:626 length:498 start_codon:yes stop_codon:yes gene_type:complete
MNKNIINKPVTDKQKSFAELIVKNSFGENSMSHSACAKKAGYAPESAAQRAYELTNPEICPNVCRYIEELKNEFRKKNKISPERHMGRLNHLGLEAEKNKMYGIAGQMEIARGKVAGYYVERKQILNNPSIDNMNLDQLYQRMKDIKKRNRHLINVKEEKKDEKK